MRKELATHYSFLLAFFLLITAFKGWFDLYYIPFWVGGLIGAILPDVDHLVYSYVLKPHELTSQRVQLMVGRRNFLATWDLISRTRRERKHLIFHTAHFQLIFLSLAFLVVTSSGSPLGRGMVLAVLLHLFIDQVVDHIETGNIDNWFTELKLGLDTQQKKWYLGFNLVILLIFGFLL